MVQQNVTKFNKIMDGVIINSDKDTVWNDLNTKILSCNIARRLLDWRRSLLIIIVFVLYFYNVPTERYMPAGCVFVHSLIRSSVRPFVRASIM